jgi:hypothetical protein
MPSRRVSRKRSQKKSRNQSRKRTHRGSKRKFFGSIKRGVSRAYNYLRTKTIDDSREAKELRRKMIHMYNVIKKINQELALDLELWNLKTKFSSTLSLKDFKKDMKDNIFELEDMLESIPEDHDQHEYLNSSLEMLKEDIDNL